MRWPLDTHFRWFVENQFDQMNEAQNHGGFLPALPQTWTWQWCYRLSVLPLFSVTAEHFVGKPLGAMGLILVT